MSELIFILRRCFYDNVVTVPHLRFSKVNKCVRRYYNAYHCIMYRLLPFLRLFVCSTDGTMSFMKNSECGVDVKIDWQCFDCLHWNCDAECVVCGSTRRRTSEDRGRPTVFETVARGLTGYAYEYFLMNKRRIEIYIREANECGMNSVEIGSIPFQIRHWLENEGFYLSRHTYDKTVTDPQCRDNCGSICYHADVVITRETWTVSWP